MYYGEPLGESRHEPSVPDVCSASVHRAVARDTAALHYLCDGASDPNPGATQPIAFDGARFLHVPAGVGGNHRAVYGAVLAALADAKSRGAAHVCVWLFSRHVFGQLSGGVGVDHLALEYSRTRRAADGFTSVHWVRVAPPVALIGTIVRSRKAFRRLARRNLGPSIGASTAAPCAAHTPSPISSAANAPAPARVAAPVVVQLRQP